MIGKIIATLPPIQREELMEEIMSSLWVDAVRYNVGMDSPYNPLTTLRLVKLSAARHGKKLWLDLKGRQLRITHWAAPNYGKIILNHPVEVEGPARVHFRGSGWTDLKLAQGRVIYVDPIPPEAVGAGQAVNIVGDNVKIKGYLTKTDKEYLEAAKMLGVDAILLSFVEERSDIDEVLSFFKDYPGKIPSFGLKIESYKGLQFFGNFFRKDIKNYPNMDIFPILARDDLFNEIGGAISVHSISQMFVEIAKNAVAASKFFPSLMRDGEASSADISDWHLLRKMGYWDFMLQDGLCLEKFYEAISTIEAYYYSQGITREDDDDD